MCGPFLLLAGTLAFAGPPLSIEARVDEGPWLAHSVSPLKRQMVRLRVTPAAGGAIRWYQVIPDVSKMYKNANFPWERDAYRWVGLTRIAYDKEELTEFRGRWEVPLFGPDGPTRWTARYASAQVSSPYYHPDVGSFWFQAEVTGPGGARRSPGPEDADRHGLPASVMRVSVRGGPGFLGHLSSFFNVPGLFGSVPLQSNNYLGSDCADTLVAARGKWLGRESDRNYNVAALVTELPRVAEFDLAGGTFSKRVEWGRPVLPGDFVAVRYKGARSYQHVGALTGDTDGDGVLSGEDTTYQAGPWPLAETPLNAGPFDGHVVVLRPSSPIKEKPIAFGEKRRKASADYSERHYGTGAGTTVTPRVVVLHWTNTATLKAAFNAFDKEELEGRPDIAAGGTLNVSAHFLVDRDGTIHRLMPETRMARHVIGLNLVAVGIENVGADNLTEDQVRANAWLVRDLKERYPTITHLIGHHEHQRLEGTPLWTEREAGYRTVKPDPGPGFMKKVRGLVADLGLVP